MMTILVPITVSLFFAFIIFILLFREKRAGYLKIKLIYIILIPVFAGIITFSIMYNLDNHIKNKKSEASEVVVKMVENFKKNNKEVLTVQEQEKLISDDFKNSSYLRNNVRVSFLEKSAVFVIKSIADNDYFCKKTIYNVSQLAGSNKYKVTVNYKDIKEVVNNKNEMENVCNRDKLTIIKVYL